MNLQGNESSSMPEEKSWYTVNDLREYNRTAVSYLWEPYFPMRALCGITGPSDCGKSTLMKQLALAIASRQTTFLGHPLHVNHGKVCYLSTEDEQVSTWRVLAKQIAGSGMSFEDDALVFAFDVAGLEKYLEEHGDTLDLVIVDTLSDIFNGNPNNLVDVRANLRRFSELARNHNLCVVVVHHNVKNSDSSEPDKNKMNGSQAFEAKLRCVVDLRLKPGGQSNERQLTVIKGNHLPQEQKNTPHGLQLSNEHLLFEYQGVLTLSGSQRSGGRFDKDLWLERMARCKEKGMSYATAVEYLKEELPDEKVPSETWFKENYKEPVGQSDSTASDGPTKTNPLFDALNGS